MSGVMQMITDGQQQQQLIAQKQRARREELVKEQRAQNERQEQCEGRLQAWQEGFAQMQQQQHQQVMTEYC
jgi:inorganic pyrophosphatase